MPRTSRDGLRLPWGLDGIPGEERQGGHPLSTVAEGWVAVLGADESAPLASRLILGPLSHPQKKVPAHFIELVKLFLGREVLPGKFLLPGADPGERRPDLSGASENNDLGFVHLLLSSAPVGRSVDLKLGPKQLGAQDPYPTPNPF